MTLRAFRRWNVFLWVAGSAHFALVYALNTQTFLDLDLFVRGGERIPFQYRALTAWLLWLAERFVPLSPAFAARLPPRLNSVAVFAIAAIAFVSMLTAVYATRRALERLTADSESSRWWALVVLLMASFHYLLSFGRPCCEPLQMPYDLPGVAFFSLGLWVIVTRRVLWLYPLLALAMTNRESAIFLVAMYAFFEYGMRRADLSAVRGRLLPVVLHAFGLAFLCLAVLHGMHALYPAAQSGMASMGQFENHASDNIKLLLRPYYWLSYLSMFAFSWLYVYANWRRVPHAGIRWALTTGPLLLACTWVVGVLSEIRIFGELIPVMTVALTLLLRAAARSPAGTD